MADIEVTVFTEKDVPDVMVMGAKFIDESPLYRTLKFNKSRSEKQIRSYIPETGREIPRIGFVAHGEGDLLGFIFAKAFIHPFLDAVVAQDVLLYVDGPARHRRVGSALIAAFTRWAREDVHAQIIMLGSSSGINAKNADEFYLQNNYTPIGLLAVHNL